MRYLRFPSRANARSRSSTIATALGCNKQPDDLTRFWFGTIEHPETAEAALCVPDGEEHRLAEQERDSLKDHAFMQQQGWFPEDEP